MMIPQSETNNIIWLVLLMLLCGDDGADDLTKQIINGSKKIIKEKPFSIENLEETIIKIMKKNNMEKISLSSKTLETVKEYIKQEKIKEMEKRKGFPGIHIKIGEENEQINKKRL